MSEYVIYWRMLSVTKNNQGGKVNGKGWARHCPFKQGGHDRTR